MTYHIKRDSDNHSISAPSSSDQILQNVLLAAYQEQRRARIWKTIWRVIFLLFTTLAIITLAHSCSTAHSISTTMPMNSAITTEHTAIVSLNGELSSTEYHAPVSQLRQGLHAAYANPAVKAIIIRANSPGGSPVLSNIAFEEIRFLRQQNPKIPLYVVIEDMCASGCYYIAAAADKIYADPSSLVGSIGVIGSSFDATELMDKLGIKRRVRIAGENKGMGDPFVPESEEQKIIWQSMLNDIHQHFIHAVQTGRGHRLDSKNNPDLFSGRVYTGSEAKKNGLIDDFGNIYSISRDIIHAPELVDYTPNNHNLFQMFNQQLGASTLKQIQNHLSRPW